MLQRILVPVDMSACSLAALRYGAFLGEHNGSELYVLHVADSFDLAVGSAEQLAGGAVEVGPAAAPIRQFLQDGQRQIVKDAHIEVICGDVSEAILRAVEQHGIDIVVMGSHGAGDTHGSVIGHVVKDVARQAECAVVPVFEPVHRSGLFSLSPPKSALQDMDSDILDESMFADADEIDERPSAGALRTGMSEQHRGSRVPTH